MEPSQLVEDDSKSPDVQLTCTQWSPLSRFDPDKGSIGDGGGDIAEQAPLAGLDNLVQEPLF
jgi:hypothetical protein